MCLFTHVAAGAIAGALSPNPYAAVPLGIAFALIPDIENLMWKLSIGFQMAAGAAGMAFLIRRGV